MGFDLPSNDEERELFLRALREYSENCEPPELTPGSDCGHAAITSSISGAGMWMRCISDGSNLTSPPA